MVTIFRCACLFVCFLPEGERRLLWFKQRHFLLVIPVETKDDHDFPALNHVQLVCKMECGWTKT